MFGKPIYKTVKDVDHEIQGAVVVVAAKFVPQTMKDLMEKGAKWITLVTGGFAESKTKEGKEAQVACACLSFTRRTKSSVWPTSTSAVSSDPTAWVCMIPRTWTLSSFPPSGGFRGFLSLLVSPSLASDPWASSRRAVRWA